MIRVENLIFDYAPEKKIARKKIISDISLSFPPSSFTSIVGPSGCGKTTFLNCLGGLLQQYRGKVLLDEQTPRDARNQHLIGLVFQKPIFFEWLNVFENTALPLRIAQKTSLDAVSFYLEKFGLKEYIKSFPHQLSGGMLARVALARALVHEPKFVLMDEAFNFLDEALKDKINQDIQEYWINKKPTIVAITHNIREAVFLSDRVIVLSNKPAEIVKSFEINFARPRESSLIFNKEFIQKTNEIHSTLMDLYK